MEKLLYFLLDADLASKTPELKALIKKEYGVDDSQAQGMIDILNQCDPTGDAGTYTPWVVNEVIKGHQNQPGRITQQDFIIEEIRRILNDFHTNKNRPTWTASKAIQEYTWQTLNETIERIRAAGGIRDTSRSKERHSLPVEGVEGVRAVYNKGGWLILEISSVKGAMAVAKNTAWCVKQEHYAVSYVGNGKKLYCLYKNWTDGEQRAYALWKDASYVMDVDDQYLVGEAYEQVFDVMLDAKLLDTDSFDELGREQKLSLLKKHKDLAPYINFYGFNVSDIEELYRTDKAIIPLMKLSFDSSAVVGTVIGLYPELWEKVAATTPIGRNTVLYIIIKNPSLIAKLPSDIVGDITPDYYIEMFKNLKPNQWDIIAPYVKWGTFTSQYTWEMIKITKGKFLAQLPIETLERGAISGALQEFPQLFPRIQRWETIYYNDYILLSKLIPAFVNMPINNFNSEVQEEIVKADPSKAGQLDFQTLSGVVSARLLAANFEFFDKVNFTNITPYEAYLIFTSNVLTVAQKEQIIPKINWKDDSWRELRNSKHVQMIEGCPLLIKSVDLTYLNSDQCIELLSTSSYAYKYIPKEAFANVRDISGMINVVPNLYKLVNLPQIRTSSIKLLIEKYPNHIKEFDWEGVRADPDTIIDLLIWKPELFGTICNAESLSTAIQKQRSLSGYYITELLVPRPEFAKYFDLSNIDFSSKVSLVAAHPEFDYLIDVASLTGTEVLELLNNAPRYADKITDMKNIDFRPDQYTELVGKNPQLYDSIKQPVLTSENIVQMISKSPSLIDKFDVSGLMPGTILDILTSQPILEKSFDWTVLTEYITNNPNNWRVYRLFITKPDMVLKYVPNLLDLVKFGRRPWRLDSKDKERLLLSMPSLIDSKINFSTMQPREWLSVAETHPELVSKVPFGKFGNYDIQNLDANQFKLFIDYAIRVFTKNNIASQTNVIDRMVGAVDMIDMSQIPENILIKTVERLIGIVGYNRDRMNRKTEKYIDMVPDSTWRTILVSHPEYSTLRAGKKRLLSFLLGDK